MIEAGAEAAELRRRLAEAEDTLRAIRDGEVDALIVRDSDQDRVFHLGDSQAYRAFMEAMDLGAVALDEEQGVLYANAALLGLLQTSTEALQRQGLFAALGAAGETVAELLGRARSERQSAQVTLMVGGRRLHLVVSAAPMPLGFSHGWALTFTDISDRIEAAAAEEGERIGEAVMASANEAVVVCDLDGVVTHANPAILNILETSPVGARFEEAVPLSFAAGAGPMAADDLVAIALSGSSVRGIEATVLADAKVKDLLISAAPLRHTGGGIGGCTITLVDLSTRKALEKRQALLMRELDHRMKNMLALVLSISTRTLAGAASLDEFKDRFGQRLAALAATQNLLAEQGWEGLSIADLLKAELAPYVAVRSHRVLTEGLSIEISRDAAVALGLVFHELVTNAVKYGALSSEAGQVSVTARARPDGLVEIAWREQGGPPVSPPTRRGFGQTVIARGLGGSAAEPTQVEFAPAGLVCRMVLAADALV